jgi:hypothetical protein
MCHPHAVQSLVFRISEVLGISSFLIGEEVAISVAFRVGLTGPDLLLELRKTACPTLLKNGQKFRVKDGGILWSPSSAVAAYSISVISMVMVNRCCDTIRIY